MVIILVPTLVFQASSKSSHKSTGVVHSCQWTTTLLHSSLMAFESFALSLPGDQQRLLVALSEQRSSSIGLSSKLWPGLSHFSGVSEGGTNAPGAKLGGGEELPPTSSAWCPGVVPPPPGCSYFALGGSLLSPCPPPPPLFKKRWRKKRRVKRKTSDKVPCTYPRGGAEKQHFSHCF